MIYVCVVPLYAKNPNCIEVIALLSMYADISALPLPGIGAKNNPTA